MEAGWAAGSRVPGLWFSSSGELLLVGTGSPYLEHLPFYTVLCGLCRVLVSSVYSLHAPGGFWVTAAVRVRDPDTKNVGGGFSSRSPLFCVVR